MKYLHIMPHNKTGVVTSYIAFICEHFEHTEHEFLLWKNSDTISTDGLPSKARIRSENYIDVHVIKSFKLYEKILFHMMYLSVKQKLYLMLHPKLYKKIVWMPWGKDLYKWRGYGFGSTLKSKASKYITYLFNRNINIFVGIFPPDIAFYKKEFKSCAKTFYAAYNMVLTKLFNDNPELLEKMYEQNIKTESCDNPINIMVGHNCSIDLKHIEMLDAIDKFKNRKIRIHLPLSYDNKVNGDYIEKYAKQKFGEKVVGTEDNLLWRIQLDDLSSDIDKFSCNAGYFSEYHASSLLEVSKIINRKYQTLAYYGFSENELKDFIAKSMPFGIDRIVPIGKTMDFSLVWDGYNMINSLSRRVEIN